MSEDRKEIFEGDALGVRRVGSDHVPLIAVIRDPDGANNEILGEFCVWEYWVKEGVEGDYAKALKNIWNVVDSGNPAEEKVKLIIEEIQRLHKIK